MQSISNTIFAILRKFCINHKQTFFDEFRVCNSMGTKNRCHKLGIIYFAINNLPRDIKNARKKTYIWCFCVLMRKPNDLAHHLF